MSEIKIPRKARTYPVNFNPLRVLYAAVVNQAARDLANPETAKFDRFTAHAFLNHEKQFIADTFGVQVANIDGFLHGVRYAA